MFKIPLLLHPSRVTASCNLHFLNPSLPAALPIFKAYLVLNLSVINHFHQEILDLSLCLINTTLSMTIKLLTCQGVESSLSPSSLTFSLIILLLVQHSRFLFFYLFSSRKQIFMSLILNSILGSF